MQFHEITSEDLPKIKNIVELTNYQTCQLSIASLFCYAEKYNTKICFKDDFLFVKQSRENYNECYFMPIGTGDLKQAIIDLSQYHKDNSVNNDFVLWGMADDMLEKFKAVLPEHTQVELFDDRDWAEYIHTSENLLEMKGKHFHAKKNAVNQFLRNNRHFHYESIDESNIAEVIAFQEKLLCGIKKFETDEKTINDLVSENSAITKGLNNFFEIGLIGGIIRIDDDVSAYAFGSSITANTFDMLIEKALRNYNGIYQVLEQEMIKNNLSPYTYINREEDLGIEGLRFSKLKLRPDYLLMKTTAIMKYDALPIKF